jgi:hypothetical protein
MASRACEGEGGVAPNDGTAPATPQRPQAASWPHSLAVGFRRRLRHASGTLLIVSFSVVAASISVALGLYVAEEQVELFYYFSSFFQGLSSALGISLSIALVASQLATTEYGPLVGPRQFLTSRTLRWSLASYGVVLGVSAVALGADPSGRLAGVAAGVVFMAGTLAGMTTVLFIVEVVRGLTPTGVARRLGIRLARGYLMAVTGGPRESEDEGRSHFDTTSLLEAIDLFERQVGRGWHPWRGFLNTYMRGLVLLVSSQRDLGVRAHVAAAMLNPFCSLSGVLPSQHRQDVVLSLRNCADRFLFPLVSRRDVGTGWTFLALANDVYWDETLQLVTQDLRSCLLTEDEVKRKRFAVLAALFYCGDLHYLLQEALGRLTADSTLRTQVMAFQDCQSHEQFVGALESATGLSREYLESEYEAVGQEWAAYPRNHVRIWPTDLAAPPLTPP